MEYNDLLLLKDTFYTMSNIPMYLLKESYEIQEQTKAFVQLPATFFQNFFTFQEHRYSVYFTDHEVYIFFRLLVPQKHITYVGIGPLVYNLPKHISNLDFMRLFQYGNILNQQEVLKQLPLLDNHLYNYFQFLYGMFYQEKITREQFYQYFYRPRDLKYQKEFYETVSSYREEMESETTSYQNELLFLDAIKNGNSAYARIYASKLANGKIGKMSNDQLRNGKYALIAAITLISRTSIDVGVNPENAYAMSDVYIRKVDEEYDIKKLMLIMYDAIMDFCKLVTTCRQQEYPAWIRSCMEYMDQHLHIDISLEELSDVVHLTPAYISVQFKRIVGRSIKQYLNEQRIHEAQFLLKTTDMSIQEIALTLNFGTQSYFTKVFKDIKHTLPSTYRNQKKH